MRETASPAPITRPAKVVAWTLLISGFLLLTFAAALRADARSLNGRATRTQNFNATGAIRSLSVENVSGDVTVTAGPSFKAVVELTARAENDAEARKALERTDVRFQNQNGELSIVVDGKDARRSHGRWNFSSDEDGWRVDARCTITLPKEAALEVSLVNGKVSSQGIAGEQEIGTVNGTITVTGARSDLRLNTVNGTIDGTFADLPRGADVKAETVNGSIVLRLPARSGFVFKGHTMSGKILTTFPLPPSEDEAEMERAKAEMKAAREKMKADRDRVREDARRERERLRKERERARAKGEDVDEDDDLHVDVDMSELNRSMRELERDLSNMSREISRSVTMSMNRSYEGTVGGGGASIKCSTLNGKIVVLGEGTREEDAKALVSGRRAQVLTIPPVAPVAPVAPVPPVPPAPRVGGVPAPHPAPRVRVGTGLSEESGSIVKGDVSGDFYASLPMGDITLGKVSGRVKASTHSGEIRVAEAGSGAELFSSGGDVSIEAVTGGLKARTYGGDMRVGRVTGDATLDTAGGDIVVRSAGGSVDAETGGGDVRLEKVRGPVRARTGGGSVTCEITSASTTGDLSTGGGDVTLTLPQNFKGEVEVRVNGVDSDGTYILSDFPELAITRGRASQTASGKLNGGGPKVTIRTSSGTVILRKGPAA